MMLWIIAAIAGAILLAGIAFLALDRDGEAPAKQATPEKSERRDAAERASDASPPGGPWDKRSDEPPGSRLASVPPPGGVPMHPTASAEMSAEITLESQELWIDDDEPTGPVPRIVLSAEGRTHPGQKRSHNEDAFLVDPEHEVYAVADGMGGYAAGEIASRMAIETLQSAYATGAFGAVEDGFPRRGAELMSVVRAANSRIRDAANEDEQKHGMGTTMVAARFSPGRNRVYLAHVGDSRCYRIRDDEMKQLTTDHTLGAVGIKGPSAGKLSRAVGVFDELEVDLTVDEPQPGDYYLLCSDGLFKMVPESIITHMVMRERPIAETVDELVKEANDRGGRDNVTVVLVRVDAPDFDPGESGEHRLPG